MSHWVIESTHLYQPFPPCTWETDLGGDLSYPIGKQWQDPAWKPRLQSPKSASFPWPRMSRLQAPAALDKGELLDDTGLVSPRKKRRGPTLEKNPLCSRHWARGIARVGDFGPVLPASSLEGIVMGWTAYHKQLTGWSPYPQDLSM